MKSVNIITAIIGAAILLTATAATASASPDLVTTTSTNDEREALGCQKLNSSTLGGKHTPILEDETKALFKCLDEVQRHNAAEIITAGKELGADETAIARTLAASIQETTILNLYNPNVKGSKELPHDNVHGTSANSVGTLQQQTNWLPLEIAQNVRRSAQVFMLSLEKAEENNLLKGLNEGEIIQCIQQSRFPAAYDENLPLAKEIIKETQVPQVNKISEAEREKLLSFISTDSRSSC